MANVRENIAYKTADQRFRSADEYAQGKYDLTTRWLAPRIQAGQLLLNIGCGSGCAGSVSSSHACRCR